MRLARVHNGGMRTWGIAVCVVLLVSACSSAGNGAVSTTRPTQSSTPDVTMVSSTSIVLAAAQTTLACADQIGWPRTVPPGYAVSYGRVALPTGKAFSAVRFDPSKPKSKFWAKQGLLVKPGTAFELIVPAAWTSRLTIEWGNPGHATTHLWVTSCASKQPGAHWLAYAGGFTINKPACIPLIVKTSTAQRTVHLGAGKACPGQAPPRN